MINMLESKYGYSATGSFASYRSFMNAIAAAKAAFGYGANMCPVATFITMRTRLVPPIGNVLFIQSPTHAGKTVQRECRKEVRNFCHIEIVV